MTHAIYNFNLLSTNLASASWHKNCDAKHLDTNYRWNIIKERLQSQMNKTSIICLQELSTEWISLILLLAIENDYIFVYDSQFLGVGIAFPNDKYTLLNMNMICIGEIIKKNQNNKTKETQVKKFWNWVKHFFITKKDDVWTLASRKTNRLVGVTLANEGQIFNVFTYHMPCAFMNPPLMNIHASALLSTVQSKSESVPYILAGDFNSKSDSDVYKIITSKMRIPSYTGITSIYSAYFAIMHKEPLYTNHSANFTDCIDYIFGSEQIKFKSVLDVCNDFPKTPAFPNHEEPSDHLPIGCSFSIQGFN